MGVLGPPAQPRPDARGHRDRIRVVPPVARSRSGGSATLRGAASAPVRPVGRYRRPMTDAAPGDWVVAVDIGGTKLAAALVDGAGRLIERRQVPTATPEADP